MGRRQAFAIAIDVGRSRFDSRQIEPNEVVVGADVVFGGVRRPAEARSDRRPCRLDRRRRRDLDALARGAVALERRGDER
jgi:hypothetical protein